jgi:mannose-6-phosphate isomerase-like protein (cupin superfamily)
MTGRLRAVTSQAGAAAMLEKVNIREKFDLFREAWSPKLVAEVNDTDVKLVRLEGEFIWHQHPEEDELFLVLDGRLRLEFRDREVWLEPGELLVVPRGVEHRPVAPTEALVMLVERRGTINTGDVRNERTVASPERI